MNTDKAAALISALWIFGGLIVGGFALAPSSHAGPFDQRDFPCQEDEVLGYSPAFGPDHVGCMHVEVSGNIGTKLGEYVPGTNPLDVMIGN